MALSTPPRTQPDDRLARLLSADTRAAGGGGTVVEREAVAGSEAEEPGEEWDDRPMTGRHRAVGVPLVSVPSSLRSAELGVGARAVRGLLLLVLVAAVVLGARWAWGSLAAPSAASAPEAAAEQRVAAAVLGSEGATVEPGAGEAEPRHAAAPTELVIHVTGQVEEPGVVRLPPGARVVDAVRAAGGLTGAADQASLNLARVLVDGEQVWVGRPGESPPAAAPAPAGSPGTVSGGSGGGGAASPLDLNLATRADLEALPGIGPVTAGHILSWREAHGRFSAVDELLEVSGIGERTLAQLEPLVTVGG